jgi:hypothetical protein
MPSSPFTSWRRRKPPSQAAAINWNHPLTRNLVFATVLAETAGPSIDLITGKRSTLSTTPFYGPTPLGAGAVVTASAGWHDFGDNTSWHPGTSTGLTMMAVTNSPSESTARGLIAKRNNSTVAQIGLYANLNDSGVASAGAFCLFLDDGTNAAAVACTTASLMDGNFHQYAVTMSTPGAGLTGTAYFDGRARGTGTAGGSTAPNYTGTDHLQVGGYDSTVGANCTIAYAYYWLRALSAAEVLWLYQEPFAFLQQPARVTYYVPPVVNATASALPASLAADSNTGSATAAGSALPGPAGSAAGAMSTVPASGTATITAYPAGAAADAPPAGAGTSISGNPTPASAAADSTPATASGSAIAFALPAGFATDAPAGTGAAAATARGTPSAAAFSSPVSAATGDGIASVGPGAATASTCGAIAESPAAPTPAGLALGGPPAICTADASAMALPAGFSAGSPPAVGVATGAASAAPAPGGVSLTAVPAVGPPTQESVGWAVGGSPRAVAAGDGNAVALPGGVSAGSPLARAAGNAVAFALPAGFSPGVAQAAASGDAAAFTGPAAAAADSTDTASPGNATAMALPASVSLTPVQLPPTADGIALAASLPGIAGDATGAAANAVISQTPLPAFASLAGILASVQADGIAFALPAGIGASAPNVERQDAVAMALPAGLACGAPVLTPAADATASVASVGGIALDSSTGRADTEVFALAQPASLAFSGVGSLPAAGGSGLALPASFALSVAPAFAFDARYRTAYFPWSLDTSRTFNWSLDTAGELLWSLDTTQTFSWGLGSEAPRVDLAMNAGEAMTWIASPVTLVPGGIAGWPLRWRVLSPSDGTVLLVKDNSTNGGVTILDPTAETIQIQTDSADTAEWEQREYRYYLDRVDVEPPTVLAKGILRVGTSDLP